MQVYRGMDIGTAKPSADEQARVPHHCIDLTDPDDDYTVSRVQAAYREAVAAIADRGRLPLLVGGTGLYIRAILEGLVGTGCPEPELRKRLEDEQEKAAEEVARVRDEPAAAGRKR